VRNDDIVCRLGGDEFLVICPRTPLEGAKQLAEKLCREVSAMRVRAGTGEWRGSISIGVAVRKAEMSNFEALIKAADDGVYCAKKNGRSCVGIAS
jgi:hemerythrin